MTFNSHGCTMSQEYPPRPTSILKPGGPMMKRLHALALTLLIPAALAAQSALVIDHHCTDPDSIPARFLDSARTRFRIGYGHTSHGSQVVTGWTALTTLHATKFSFTSTSSGLHPGVFLNDYWGDPAGGYDLGYNGDTTWRNATRTMLNLPANDRNVVAWSWCAGVSSNTNAGIDAYLSMMDSLEKQYPKVRFVYMTGHLDGTGITSTLHLMNERIRQYCRTHGKTLFDFADIESFAPGSDSSLVALYADDNCDYDTNGDYTRDKNWAQSWITANPTSRLAQVAAVCGECAHSQHLNCVRKGIAFWWMLARMAGWSGGSGGPATTDIGTNILPSALTLHQNYPNPFNPSSDIRYLISELKMVRLAVYDVLGREVAVLVNETRMPGAYTVRFDASGLASGVYLYRLTTGSFVATKKMAVMK